MFIIIVRTILLYFAVILAIRIMGKRQIGDLQPSELVITILISEIAAIPLQDITQPVLSGIFAIFTLVTIEVIMSFITMKCLPFRKLFYGKSAILIKDGKIDQKMLSKLRITVPDLVEILRCAGTFEISNVDYAILETNGQLSVLTKSKYQQATLKDLGVKRKNESLPYLLVSDGKILKEALKSSGISREEIDAELYKRNFKLEDVFLMTADKYRNFIVIKSEGKK